MDSGVKQLALSFGICTAFPAQKGHRAPENKRTFHHQVE